VKLLGVNDAKTPKGEKLGYLTGVLYLIPDDRLCPMSKLAGCREPCLVTSGRGRMKNVVAGRQRKTQLFKDSPANFVELLTKDIKALERAAERRSLTPVVRLNGTSDIAWENVQGVDGTTLMERFPHLQFYDYTKLPTRKVPENYHLTVSYSGANPDYADKALNTKHNVAVVFGDGKPTTWQGREVVDGDAHDLRFLDESGVVVGLKPKGDAKHDTSGFVVYNDILARG